MTTSEMARVRVDLFTDIHKALRKALFDLSVRAGATDWGDAKAVAGLASAWKSLAELLRCHTDHENEHIFRLLGGTDRAGILPEEDHRDLDDLLDDLDRRLSVLIERPESEVALTWYRDLNRYIAATLEHLQVEESVVQPALWATCSDDELSACRATFLAATPRTVLDTTMSLFLGALPAPALRGMGLLP